VIIGSQAILATWPDAPRLLRRSGEIDAYPENARQWEALHSGAEASEEINALFGAGSDFHRAHGFYIDGVDESTALLPVDWRDRLVRRPITADNKIVHAITPEVHDLVVSKLCRLDPKDREFIETLHRHKRIDAPTLLERLKKVRADAAILKRADEFVRALGKG
jgi:hypothetical protein